MAMAIDLAEIGLTQEELQQRVVSTMTSQLLRDCYPSEDGVECLRDSPFAKELQALVKTRIAESVTALADKHILPSISDRIENLCLEETNKWGEKSGKKLSFIEYLIERAEAYMTETVNYEGKTKGNAYSWTGTQTRITHMVHQHLHYSIESAMKQALKTANEAIVGGIRKAVELKLAEVQKSLKVKVETK
ncbi:hypothetical protein LCGC14_1464150, partial [marine sediment metagenome]